MTTISNTGVRSCTVDLTSTTAQAWTLSGPVNQLVVINTEAAAAWVTLITSTAPITDDANVVTAVAEADETYCIPGVTTSGPMGMRTILKSPRPTYVAGSVVANGNKVVFEGHNWY